MPNEQQKNLTPDGFEKVDGALIAARILRKMPVAQRHKIIEIMRETNATLAVNVQTRMYNFAELSTLSAKHAQTLVREVEHKDLVISLKGAAQEIQQHLLTNMSQRKRALVMDEAAHTPDPGPEKLREAQWRILEKMEELKERGLLPLNSNIDIA